MLFYIKFDTIIFYFYAFSTPPPLQKLDIQTYDLSFFQKKIITPQTFRRAMWRKTNNELNFEYFNRKNLLLLMCVKSDM